MRRRPPSSLKPRPGISASRARLRRMSRARLGYNGLADRNRSFTTVVATGSRHPTTHHRSNHCYARLQTTLRASAAIAPRRDPEVTSRTLSRHDSSPSTRRYHSGEHAVACRGHVRIDVAGRRRSPVPDGSLATEHHRVVGHGLRRRWRAARRPQRRLPAQHGEPAAPRDRALPPLRRGRDGPRRRVRQRDGELSQPLREDGWIRSRARGGRSAVGRARGAAVAIAARRVGCALPDEGRVVDGRRGPCRAWR